MSYENLDKHVRTKIRHSIAKALVNLPIIEDRVFISRVYPLESAALPGIIISTESDQADEEIEGWSRLQLSVKAYAKANNHVDDILDQIEFEIRETLIKNETLNDICEDITWFHTTIRLENNGEHPIGMADIIFNIDYRSIGY